MRLRSLWPVYLAAPVMLTGIHVLLPALPVIQGELSLSDSQIALVTSLYLLPGVVAAIPAGLLADRFGRRAVLTTGLAIFGIGGLFLTLYPDSFAQMLAVRAIQGAASGMVLPLTVTIIGDAVSGPQQVTAQGFRSVAMRVGDGFLPLVGGLLVGLAWWAPFATQIVALPMAAVAWVKLKDLVAPVRSGEVRRSREFRGWVRDRPILALQASGFLRFFFKLALATYLPVLAVSKDAASVPVIGTLLALSAVAATIGGPGAGWLAARQAPSLLIGVSLAVIAASLGAMAIRPTFGTILLAVVAFGLADGVYGTLINAAITQAVPAELRATFVGFSATVRNLGKFAAPTAIGTLVLVIPLQAAFGVVAVVAAIAVASASPLRRFDPVIRARAPVVELPVEA